jgi:hypothetical protein
VKKGTDDMNASNRTAVEAAAIEIVQERVEVDHDRVAEALAREIVNEHRDSLEPADAIEAGDSKRGAAVAGTAELAAARAH